MQTPTLESTVTAIVDRSLPLAVPLDGGLTLVQDRDGRYRLCEELFPVPGRRKAIQPRSFDGRKLPAGHTLTHPEAVRCVRILLGLDETPKGRPRGKTQCRHIAASA